MSRLGKQIRKGTDMPIAQDKHSWNKCLNLSSGLKIAHHEGAWGRWPDATLEIRSRSRSNLAMRCTLCVSQHTILSQFYKLYSRIPVWPKAVLPVHMIHLFASAKCLSLTSNCSTYCTPDIGCGLLARLRILHLRGLIQQRLLSNITLKKLLNELKI